MGSLFLHDFTFFLPLCLFPSKYPWLTENDVLLWLLRSWGTCELRDKVDNDNFGLHSLYLVQSLVGFNDGKNFAY